MKTTTTTSIAAQAGDTDGALAYYAFMRNGTCKDYSDDFIRRRELSEVDRQAYKTAWYAAHAKTKALYRP